MELMDGFLYLHMDLGSGAVKMMASNQRLAEGETHSVEVLRNGKAGTVSIDDQLTTFTTPGKNIVEVA